MPIKRRVRKVGTPGRRQATTSSVNRVGTLNDDTALAERYAKLGASVEYDPLPFLSTRRFLLGQRRFGKTILMAGQTNTAYLDFDGGSGNRRMGPGTVRFPIPDYAALEEIFKVFRYEVTSGTFPFEHLVFDTIDTFRQVTRERMSAEKKIDDIINFGKGGKGYDMMTRRCLSFLVETTTRLKVGWTVIGHFRFRTVKDESGEELSCWAPAINEGLSNGIAQLADLIMEIKRVSYKVPGAEKKPGAKKYAHRYILETITPPETDWTTHELGTRVPMNEQLEIPKIGGIDILEDEYNKAVELERKNW